MYWTVVPKKSTKEAFKLKKNIGYFDFDKVIKKRRQNKIGICFGKTANEVVWTDIEEIKYLIES